MLAQSDTVKELKMKITLVTARYQENLVNLRLLM